MDDIKSRKALFKHLTLHEAYKWSVVGDIKSRKARGSKCSDTNLIHVEGLKVENTPFS